MGIIGWILVILVIVIVIAILFVGFAVYGLVWGMHLKNINDPSARLMQVQKDLGFGFGHGNKVLENELKYEGTKKWEIQIRVLLLEEGFNELAAKVKGRPAVNNLVLNDSSYSYDFGENGNQTIVSLDYPSRILSVTSLYNKPKKLKH
jgi:hypothetical protein